MSDRRALLMLLKAYREKKWAAEFLNGCLYCNTLEYYRECEGERQDPEEGTITLPVENMELRIGDHVVPGKTIKRFTYRPNLVGSLNVFCMYSWTPPFVDEDRIALDKETQLGSLRTLEDAYGPHAVLIKDIPEFFRRITTAVDRQDSVVVRAKGSPVVYKSLNSIPERDDLIDAAFHKNPRYSGESEYRFAFLTDREKPGPLRLNVDDIRDIAVLCRTREIYDSIAVNGSNEF